MTSPLTNEERDRLVERLRERAVAAREERTATSLGDALAFEAAAAEITRLRAEVERKDVALRLTLAALDDYTEWHARGLDVRDPPSLDWSKQIASDGHAARSPAE